ncbi:MAG TPA: flavin reductase family protein [Croceibacterium sp.]|nr:flavin reductase family protein [Croceibacterium sp.]
MTGIDPLAFRNALGRFATGVTVVTTADAEGRKYGVTANSYNSVSLDPPLILWSLARSSRSMAAFAECRFFVVHVLGAHQEDLALRFAARGDDKFAGMAVREGAGGAPLFDDCLAHFECRVEDRIEGGDHVIFLGHVVGFAAGDHDPLIFHSGRFTRVENRPGT